MKEIKTWQKWKNIIKCTFFNVIDDNILKLSASLAYYTIFSMGPLLLMLISLCTIFFGRQAVDGKIYGELEGFIGHDTAIQLEQIIKNAAINGKGNVAGIIGGITLLIGATGVFNEIQDSINLIWGFKPKPKKGWVKLIQNRFLSFSIIISLGFLLLVSLGFTALIESFSSRLKMAWPGATITLLYVFNLILTFIISTFIFGIVFKVLPDAKIKWKNVIAGAIMTAILFMLGKFGISFYIRQSHVGLTYGTAGSVIIILVWVYYSAIILYVGAEFTKAFAQESGSEIYPADYAVKIRTIEVVTKQVQENQ